MKTLYVPFKVFLACLSPFPLITIYKMLLTMDTKCVRPHQNKDVHGTWCFELWLITIYMQKQIARIEDKSI